MNQHGKHHADYHRNMAFHGFLLRRLRIDSTAAANFSNQGITRISTNSLTKHQQARCFYLMPGNEVFCIGGNLVMRVKHDLLTYFYAELQIAGLKCVNLRKNPVELWHTHVLKTGE